MLKFDIDCNCNSRNHRSLKVVVGQLVSALLLLHLVASASALAEESIQILVFSKVADGAYKHESIPQGVKIIRWIGETRGWKVDDHVDATAITYSNLSQYDVLVFNNTAGDVLNAEQQAAVERYVRSGGGFVGIHAASDTEYDWPWYGELVGAYFKRHPWGLPKAKVIVENIDHGANKYLVAPGMYEDKEYLPGVVAEEWYEFRENPRAKSGITVLLQVDESTYSGGQMGKDHPIAWVREYQGGRSFYTTMGHAFPESPFHNPFFVSHLSGGIEWAAGRRLIQGGLLLDLDADEGLTLEEDDRVSAWQNQVTDSIARNFVKRDEGREVPGSGRPGLKRDVPELGGHNSLIFLRQELVNMREDAFDHLTQGSGYTWFAVMAPYTQSFGIKDVNAIFGNLRNGPMFEGFWGGLDDDNKFWLGSRNGVTFGRYDKNNPKVSGPILESNQHYILAGRMSAGTDAAVIDLFVNNSQPLASKTIQVSEYGDPSKMAVGQERDATNHPGAESFEGKLARLLIYERPLSDTEMARTFKVLEDRYFQRRTQR